MIIIGPLSNSDCPAGVVNLNQLQSKDHVTFFLYRYQKNRFTSNLCTPFKHDIRCASLCGVEFVVTKERREKRAQRESCLKGVQRL